ncbi:TetR/AcrR family transcriptional regulator [Nocardia inohanensis]|uniref:TetR/AcrR family transcriptional regulator n=1 Tax=Nocardia inohanensis TaxID=209246 RepID=UPI00082F3127|nr:TetR/AcrR family transcriptional regulator [Nocardia inohanensis]
MGNSRGKRSRADILAAAVELFGDKRYEEVSLEEITTRAGTAVGSVNYYFGGKRGVYLEAVAAVFDGFWEQLQDLRGPVLGRLQRGIDIVLDSAEQQPQVFLSLMVNVPDEEIRGLRDRYRNRMISAFVMEAVEGPPSPVLDAAMSSGLAAIEDLIARWVRDGLLDREQLRGLITAAFPAFILAALQQDSALRPSKRMIAALSGNGDSKDS